MGADAPRSLSPEVERQGRIVEFERELSTGAIGTIWLGRLAQGPEQGRLVQVRRVPRSLVSDQSLERLRQIVRISARLRHPDVLKFLGIGEDKGEVFCISEHLQSALLVHVKRLLLSSGTSVPLAVALRIIRDAARALVQVRAWADAQGIASEQRLLYGDSLVVAAYGETLLRDVAILTVLGQSLPVLGNPEVIAGLSPEELSGPRVMHASSEVFSLGILLWELLANRLLFSRRDAQRATSSVISQPIPHLHLIARVGVPLPDELVALVVRAVERDPRRRIPTLTALADAIDELPSQLLGSTDQVGNCIRRLGGACLGDTSHSHSWPIRAASDSPSLDAESAAWRRAGGSGLEAETLSNRRLLSSPATGLPQGSTPAHERTSERAVRSPGIGNRSSRLLRTLLVTAIIVLLLLALAAYRAALLSVFAGTDLEGSPPVVLPARVPS